MAAPRSAGQRLDHHTLEKYENIWFGIATVMILLLFVTVLASFFSGTYPSLNGEGGHHITGVKNGRLNPKNFAATSFVDRQTDICTIPPNSFALARTVEYFRVPDDVLVICLGKSTYARCGIIVNVTPLEPEWEGHVTLEFSNTTPLPAKIYAGEGCAQMLFIGGDQVCDVSYRDRGGKYQGQRGVTLPRT